MENDKEKELFGFDSGLGSQENPIQLQEVTVYGKRPNWFKRNIINPINRNVLRPVGLFVNDEIFLNKGNIRVKNALAHPKAMDAVLEGGNIAGAMVAAPFAAYAAAETAPIWMPAIRTMGLAMTPSTWIGGVSLAAGYTAPGWLLNGADFAATTYFANLAREDIDREGLNFKTGMNALLSLAPFTRDTEAINAVSNTLRFPMRSVTSFVDDVRTVRDSFSRPEAVLARELNRSIDNTRFINVPIEHVSHNGLTEGAGLNAASSSDVGFHFSPAGSPTTANIQSATLAPFVRQGIWSYTNNTQPTFVLDRGNWTFRYNPEIYQGLNPGTTPSENALALGLRNPNYVYSNNYEGVGSKSYMTVQPNFGVNLSKNVQATLLAPRVYARDNMPLHAREYDPETVSLYQLAGLLMMNPRSGAQIMHPTRGVIYANRPTVQLYNKYIKPSVDNVEDLYNSLWYADRLTGLGINPDEVRPQLLLNLHRTRFYTGNNNYSHATTISYDGELPHHLVIFSEVSDLPVQYNVYHEAGGHASTYKVDPVNESNQRLVEGWKDHVLGGWENADKNIQNVLENYIFDINPELGDIELRGQLWPAIQKMKEGMSADDLLTPEYLRKDPALNFLYQNFDEDYLKKLLMGLASISAPIMLSQSVLSNKEV